MAASIIASNFRAINKGPLVGSVDLEVVGWKLSFKECLWFRRESEEWISFFAREFTDRKGTKKRVEIITFTDDAVRARFQRAALDAVHAIVGGP